MASLPAGAESGREFGRCDESLSAGSGFLDLLWVLGRETDETGETGEAGRIVLLVWLTAAFQYWRGSIAHPQTSTPDPNPSETSHQP